MKMPAPLILTLFLGLTASAQAQEFPKSQPSIWAARPNAAAFESAEAARIETATRLIAKLKSHKGARTVSNTLAPYDEALQQINSAQYFSMLIEAVHPEAAFRDRAAAMTRRVNDVRTNMSLDPELYKALAALKLEHEDAATRYYVQRQLLQFRLGGVDKDEATRNRLKVINDQLTDQQSKFERNINDGQLSVDVSDPHELDGLPQDYIDSHKPGKDGLIKITTDYPDLFPALQFAKSDALRRRLFTAMDSRAYPANRDVMRSMLASRYEMATLLGFGSWADYNAADKMIGSGARIAEFIEQLDRATRPGAVREFQMVLAEKRKVDPSATEVSDHERSYFQEQLRRSKFDFDSQSVRPYFPYMRVRQGVIDTASALFHVSFRQERGAPAWDPGVETWDVIDKGAVIGRFYLDMHPRPGKFSHAEMVPLFDGIRGRQLPEAALLCNFPAPTTTDAGLMSPDDVQVFFHEFGHLMHMILAGKQQWAGISGISMEADFVEAPSQMLEELIRSPQVLAGFAKHYQTGAPIPAELVQRMNRASAFGRATYIARQNVFSALSYDIYKTKPAAVDVDAISESDSRRYSLYTPTPDTHMYASFGHLAGYSSAYYTYMWDKVIALDFFSQFDAANPLSGDASTRYRRSVLEPGGSVSANDLVKNFLGRPQNMQALQRWIDEGV